MSSDTEQSVPADSVAIVGIAGRFPGARTHDELFTRLLAGDELIRLLTPAELRAAKIPDEIIAHPSYVRAAGIPEDVADLDADLFKLRPLEAAIIDPQQRMFLECAWEALEDSGSMFDGDPLRTGVFASVESNTYLPTAIVPHLHQDAGAATAFQVEIGNDKDYISSRVSYKLALCGPSVCIQAACASSLVAVHVACQALLLGECDLAIAGGSRIHFPLTEGHFYQQGGASSAEPHCRAFDARASGTIRGGGAGVVVLRRTADAIRDRDHIYALILGSAVNNDGAAKVGFTAPGVAGQSTVIKDAHAVAGVDATEIGYVETHGTGTVLGDPIEIEALTAAFGGRNRFERAWCFLSALKPNIGHLGAAAGIAGLIKATMAVERGVIPGTPHFETPNPDLLLDSTPFWLSRESQPWPAGERKVAGVSSFGIGGTNAHVVIAEAPAPSSSTPSTKGDPCVLILSAATPSALSTIARNLASQLSQHDSDIRSVARSLSGRRSLPFRWSMVATTTAELVDGLASAEGESASHPTTCFLFPGQGAELPGLASDARRRYPALDARLKEIAAQLRDEEHIDVEAFWTTGHVPAGMPRTALVQPALFALEWALAELWLSWGLEPSVAIGHSIGEYVAACLAGVFSLEDGLRLTAARGRAMAKMPPGAMTAVRTDERSLAGFAHDNVWIAATNGPASVVMAGSPDAVAVVEDRLDDAGIGYRRLPVEHAFHTPHANDAVDELIAAFSGISLMPPKMPIIGNVTGRLLSSEEATDPRSWGEQMRRPVRFAEAVETATRLGDAVFLEMGPGTALTQLTRQILGSGSEFVVPTLGSGLGRERSTMLAALAACWKGGNAIRWHLATPSDAPKMRLPTYPFERKRYWFGETPGSTGTEPHHEVIELRTSAREESVKQSVGATNSAHIADVVVDLVAQLLGVPTASVEHDTTFVEQGLESLALLELSDNIRKRFGVRVSLVDLLDDVPTTELLARHISRQVPEGTSPARETLPADVQLRSSASTAEGGDQDFIEETVRAQLAIMGRQIDLLAQQVASKSVALPNVLDIRRPVAPFLRTPKPAVKLTSHPGIPLDSEPVPETPELKRFLEGFIPEYVARTALSKDAARLYRKEHADPRNSVGFRRAWKEIVYPIVSDRASGAYVWDIDGNRYVDLTLGFGVNIFGHSPAFVEDAIRAQIADGIHLGPQAALAGEVAAKVCVLTNVERVAFTNSGTEAVMAALRLARAATRRNRIAIFAGSYHGTFDGVLARPEDRNSPHGLPLAIGIPPSLVSDVVVLEYGSAEALEFVESQGELLAAVLVEPVQSRRPGYQPREFLQELREATRRTGTALIFDEIITGFRCHPGGVQALFGVTADIVTYGKILGGGMPIGVVAGRAEFLDLLDGGFWDFGDASKPEADQTLFAGTFCKHPLAMAAAHAVLTELERQGPALQESLANRTTELVGRLTEWSDLLGTSLQFEHFASQFILSGARTTALDLLLKALVHRGVFVWEGRTCFLSTAHTDEDLDYVVDAVGDASRALVAAGIMDARRVSLDGGPASVATHDLGFPLRDEQELLLLATQIDPVAAAAYNEVLVLPFEDKLDDDLMRRSVQRLVGRHESLRLAFDNHRCTQYAVGSVDVPLAIDSLDDADGWLAIRRRVDELRERVPAAGSPSTAMALLHAGADRHALVLVLPHLITDEWSNGVLRRDFDDVLTAVRSGTTASFEMAPPYSEFVRWEREMMGADRERCELYWAAQLQGVAPAPLVGASEGRERSYEAAHLMSDLPHDLAATLRQRAAQFSVTPFSLGLAAWKCTLHAMTQADVVSVAVHVAGQPIKGEADLTGYCLKVLPAATRFADVPTVLALAGAVRREIEGATAHWSISSSWLIERFWSERGRSRAPFGGTAFHLERATPVTGDATLTDVDLVGRPYTKWDASMTLVVAPAGWSADLAHSAIVSDEEAERLLTGFVAALREICGDPQTTTRAIVDAVRRTARESRAPSLMRRKGVALDGVGKHARE